jgi:GTP pyrophosphokinase
MSALGKRRPRRKASGTSGLQQRGETPATVPPPPGNEQQGLTIERLAHDGRGVARQPHGKTVFVEGALPGERVDVAVHRAHRRFDEGHSRHIFYASPERVTPPCAHFTRCGGCDLQHLAVEAQRRHKAEVLNDLLARQGIDTPPVVLLAGAASGYRRRARLGVKRDGEGRVHLGFRARGSHRLADIPDCTILMPRLDALLSPLHDLLATLEAPRQVGHLELLQSDGGVHADEEDVLLVVRQLRDHAGDTHRWQAFAEAHCLHLAQWLGRESPSLHWLTAEPSPSYRVPAPGGELTLGFGPGDFLQANVEVNRLMIDTALAWLGDVEGQSLLDLFAGVGNFSLPFAAAGARVTAVEGSPAMVQRLATNARRNGLRHTRPEPVHRPPASPSQRGRSRAFSTSPAIRRPWPVTRHTLCMGDIAWRVSPWQTCSVTPLIWNPCCCSSTHGQDGSRKEERSMVKVRDRHSLTEVGRVDIDHWIERLGEDLKLRDPGELREACALAESLELACERTHRVGSSFRMGLEMADILAELRLDQAALEAAVLYRAVREGMIDIETIGKRFGKEVASLIDGVLQMAAISASQLPSHGMNQHDQQDNLRKMLVTMIDDVRVALIKIAERTCALRQVKEASREKCQRVAREVFDIYAPLAHRLGIGQLKWELEDLSFRFLHEDEYKGIARQLAEKRVDRDRFIHDVVATIRSMLATQGISRYDVEGRAKHIYSIWRKMKRKHIDFSQVHDVHAVRILVPEISDCYIVLGLMHSRWHHVPNEFDDYIANPKKNGYQSLHTAVMGPDNKVLEIQIRTFTMHEEAELGVCAHWRYKGHDTRTKSSSYEEKIAWLRQVLEWQEEVGDFGDLREGLSSDVAPDRIYVFTPDGHVIDLPRVATPIDFAYRVHTEVGHRCRGAKVNGRIVPLTYRLETGQQVEILTASKGGPSRDWLNPGLGYVCTSRARSRIQAWFKHQARDQNLEEGRTLFEREMARLDVDGIDLETLAHRVNYATAEDMYAALGAGDLRIGQVLHQAQHLFGEHDGLEQLDRLLAKPRRTQDKGSGSDITVLGVGNLKTSMANCCHPVPGEEIVGFITQGRGVTVHRQDCPNILQLRMDEPQRIIEVEWGQRASTQYPVDIEIQAWDRSGLLRDVTGVLGQEHVNVLSVNTLTDTDEGIARLTITVEVDGLETLGRLFSRIQQLSNVIEVRRLRSGGHPGKRKETPS